MFKYLITPVLWLLCLCAQAEIKKWQDEKGRWHFSDALRSFTDNAQQNLQPSSARKHISLPAKATLTLLNSAHGQFYHYQGRSAKTQLKIVLLNHGMFAEHKTEFVAARQMLEPWQEFADQNGLTLVAPVFDNAAFAVTEDTSKDGGYRGLWGRDINADDFVHEIIDTYQALDPNYDGRFYLVGHSAGAQFANRYLVRHAERVIAAAYSAPAWLALPDEKLKWPLGMGERKYQQNWQGRALDKAIHVIPSPNWWLKAAQIPGALVVGENDLKPMRHVENIGGDDHVARAKYWVASMEAFAKRNGMTSAHQLILLPGVGHDYPKLVPAMQNFIRAHL